ncbi:MAG: sortase [Naasia sp.]
MTGPRARSPWRRRLPVEMLAAGALITLAAGATSLDLSAGPAAGATAAGATVAAADESSGPGISHTLVAQGSARSATILQDPRPLTSAATTAAARPVSLRVDAIGLEADLTSIDRDASGVLVPPAGLQSAGWFTGSAVPGATGPAVIAGHVDDTRAAGVFARLRELVPGDRIDVVLADGSAASFAVTGTLDVAKTQFPTDAVYGATPDAQLRLITCNGPYDFGAHHYANNLVVTAALAGDAR